MKINNSYNITFGSKNSPIEPFVVNTLSGPLYVEEAKPKDAGKIAALSVENESARFKYLTYQWEHPDEFQRYRGTDKIQWRKDSKAHYLDVINNNDGNTTLLTIKDKKENLKGLFHLKTFDNFKRLGLADSELGYLESGHLDFKHIHNGVEQIILYKLSEASKGIFKNILSTLNLDGNIYKGVGFESADETNPKIKLVADKIRQYSLADSTDCLLVKSISSKHTWWKKLAKQIK